LKDKKQLAAFPNVFIHVERLLDDGKNIIIHPNSFLFKDFNSKFFTDMTRHILRKGSN
jgi:hypothetical protein